jgi:YegS/Rv2252/BmrU family lipid kinase
LKVAVIVNPKAGSGRGLAAVPEVKRTFERFGWNVEVYETKGPGDARQLARARAKEAVELVAIVGGDGTLNEVSQAYLDPDGKVVSGPPLALVPFGTGGDFRRTLELPDGLEAVIERIVTAEPRPIDLGILELTGNDGKPSRNAFVNIASFGLGGLTADIVNQGPKWLGGKAAFYLGVLRGLAAYRNAPVRVKVDGRVFLESPIVNVAIANGRYFGGGMKVAPEAAPDDGLFDVVSIGDLSRLGVVANTPSIYAGKHVELGVVTTTRGTVVEAEPLAPKSTVLVEMDGETPGRLPLTARIAPRGLWFRA